VKRLLNGTTMKLVSTNSGAIGVHVELPEGPHVVDIARSFAVFATHDPISAALLSAVLKERAVWVALVNHWDHLRKPLALLARTALANPGDPRLVLRPFAQKESAFGIVALDIVDAPDVDSHDPAERLDRTRQCCESVAEGREQDRSSMGENVMVIDFRREKARRTRSE
jgi:hypothetical protein